MVSHTILEHLRAAYLIDEYYSVLDIGHGGPIETASLVRCILHAELR